MRHTRNTRRFRRWPVLLFVALVVFVYYAAHQPGPAADAVSTLARQAGDIATGLADFVRQVAA